jgi:threonylcarbamoyladenosine tRNA methylthiotransferase MtaB
MKIALNTLGCKLNQAETESFTWQLVDAGHRIVERVEDADVYILNTCTVTAIADSKSRQLIRQAYKHNPGVFIVVCGCYVEREQKRVMQIPGVSLVIDNTNKSGMLSLIKENLMLQEYVPSSTETKQSVNIRTRSFIKVQEGCNSHCSYCIVPQVRNRESSTPIQQVLTTVQKRISGGFKEIVLTGTNVGTYFDNGHNLQSLLKSILTETSIPRIRLSSLQPHEITAELLLLWRDTRLCPHFQLSLQSGCDSTLHRMKRRYSVKQYRDSVSMIREFVPEAAITTDIIVGFPGENDEEFEESYLTCKELQFARIHVFPFSPRPGTEAIKMTGVISDNIKKERCQKILALADESTQHFRRLFKGTARPVLWESRNSSGYWNGFTDNYINVKIRSTEDLNNQIGLTLIE